MPFCSLSKPPISASYGIWVNDEQLQQLDELKDQFIAHVNHELRNPVMTMRGSVELVVLAGDRLSEKERGDLLQKALRVGDG